MLPLSLLRSGPGTESGMGTNLIFPWHYFKYAGIVATGSFYPWKVRIVDSCLHHCHYDGHDNDHDCGFLSSSLSWSPAHHYLGLGVISNTLGSVLNDYFSWCFGELWHWGSF